MIVSHKHRFIFVKVNKTAGTSIEIALSRDCGPDDIITPISPDDEAIRIQREYRGPQHVRVPLRRYGWGEVKRLVRSGKRVEFFNHMGAAAIRRYVGPRVWDSYFTFCFERNPWDRLTSLYYYRHPEEPRPTFGEFLDEGARHLKRFGYEHYTIDGQIAVDRVCRFEHLAEEMEQIRLQLGIPTPFELPRTKVTRRSTRPGYRDLLTAEEAERVREWFAEEIALLGYRF